MQNSDLPVRFNIPFANAAGGSYIRAIPQASQIGVQDGAASLTDGFPPFCFTPPGYPFGQDYNGLLKQITQWNQWQQAGGSVPYDATFSAAIGGYPKGAILAAATSGSFWISTTENNVTNPDAAGAGWLGFSPVPLYAADSGAANAMVAALSPAPASLAAILGRPIVIKKGAAPSSAAVSLNLNAFGVKNVLRPDGSALAGPSLPANGNLMVVWDGANFELLSQTPTATTPPANDYSAAIATTTWVVDQFIAFQAAGLIPKAWCRFSASGGAVSGFSGNGVSSVVRSSTGIFTVTTNVNANTGAYFVQAAQTGSSVDIQGTGPGGIGVAGAYVFHFVSLANSARDPDFACILIF